MEQIPCHWLDEPQSCTQSYCAAMMHQVKARAAS
jgi:hypothetical protein